MSLPIAERAQLHHKLEDLRHHLSSLDACLIAFSGGVDSTFLLKVAVDVLGSARVLAVTAQSASLAQDELAAVRTLAATIGARHQFVETDELADPEYRANQGTRCYICKKTLFTAMRAIANRIGVRHILYGAIIDDLADERPGHRAAHEFFVQAPLQDAGLTKLEIRELSRELDLPTWDKPQMACLASRIPRGSIVSADKLQLVDAAERLVRAAGFSQVRVRHHGDEARIEVEPDDVARLQRVVAERGLVAALQALGFAHVRIDPHGYRTRRAAAHPTP